MIIPGPILLALGMGLFGILLLGFGLFCFFRARRSLPQFSEVGEGIVSGFTEADDDEEFGRPLVRFVHGGGAVTITGSFGSSPPAYRVGQRVKVRYRPGRPDLAIIADFRHLHLSNFAFIGFGAVSLGAAFLLLFLYFYLQPQ